MSARAFAWMYLSPDKYDAWEERAAIMEYDGHMPRSTAEEAALKIFESGVASTKNIP